MNTSGEAAEQVVRISLETGEEAIKITGVGAKQLAVFLYAAYKGNRKMKGKTRMESLLRTERPLTVFSVKEEKLKVFVREAKRYGVLYCAVRRPKRSRDGTVDIIVKQEDAVRINRIVEQLQGATVKGPAQPERESAKEHEGRRDGYRESRPTRKEPFVRPFARQDGKKLADELLGGTKKDTPPGREGTVRPFGQRETAPPSGKAFGRWDADIGRTHRNRASQHRMSVRTELRLIQTETGQKEPHKAGTRVRVPSKERQ